MTPRCSVVVAAHDSAATIARTVASVRLQTVEDWELIVVDDGSSDATAALVDAIPDPRIRVVRQSNLGPAGARNAGIAEARGELISTLDSDDLWLPRYLEVMTGLLDARPDADAAYIDAWTLDDASGRIRRLSAMHYQGPPVPPPTSADDFFVALLPRNFVYNSVTMRRDAVRAVGGYDERLWGTEDWGLWLHLAANGSAFVRADDRLAVYRQRSGSVSGNARRMIDEALKVYDAIIAEWDVPEQQRQLARRYRAAWEREADPPRRRGVDEALTAARSVKRAVERRVLWYAEPPPDVASAFAAIDALVAFDAGVAGHS